MSQLMDGPYPTTYRLDDSVPVRLREVMTITTPRWTELLHVSPRTRGLILLAGECLETPEVNVTPDHDVLIEWAPGLERISDDGLDLTVSMLTRDSTMPILVLPLRNPVGHRRRLRMSLPVTHEQLASFRIECGAGPDDDPTADWACVVAFVVAPVDEVERERAAGMAAWRQSNEISHFATVYDRPLYQHRRAHLGDPKEYSVVAMPRAAAGGSPGSRAGSLGTTPLAWDGAEPLAGETGYGYATRLLGSLLPPAPDFGARLRALGMPRPRLLSLCAGAGGIESLMLHAAGTPVDITFVDVDDDFLRTAARGVPGNSTVTLMRGDVNEMPPTIGEFDVVMTVSGLHHLVRLENVLATLVSVLADDGELWLIGEAVGRNGSRLWPDTYRVADEVFASLPERYRLNHNTGTVDAHLPNDDCSTANFEGIRSEEILDLVERYFLPLQARVADCFLWRLVNAAYEANFDPSRAEDAAMLRRFVSMEFDYWQSGGRGAELHGAYRKKARSGVEGRS